MVSVWKWYVTMAEERSLDVKEPLILHILVVGFHHHKGSTLEYVYPSLGSSPDPGERRRTSSITSELPPEWLNLPHLALPDGCHNYDEDSSFFTLPPLSEALGTSFPAGRCVYGVACCRQIDSRDLPRKDADVTRSTVQKSVCILSRLPLFGFIECKLKLVTEAYFKSKDFSEVSILQDALMQLNASGCEESASTSVYLGLSPQEQVLHYQHRLLQIYKALVLQKRVLIFGSPVRKLCNSVLAVGCLFPGCFEAWVNRTAAHQSDEFGFPLKILENDSIQPYFCLQQMDEMSLRGTGEGGVPGSWLLGGVVNPLFEKHREKLCDVFVNLQQEGSVTINDQALRAALRLTVADLRFCSILTDEIQVEGESADVQRAGSDEWVREQFKQYTMSLLATSLHGDTAAMGDFNHEFMAEWLQGSVFADWSRRERESEVEGGVARVDPRHICAGELSMSDIKRRLVAQASDYGLLNVHQKEKVSQVVERTQKVVMETAGKVTGVMSGVWSAASGAAYSWWWPADDSTQEGANETSSTDR